MDNRLDVLRERERQALIQIARCAIFANGPAATSPCQTVLAVQPGTPDALRQVPEPWRGRIDSPLLFVSSNPSIDLADDSPLTSYSNDSIVNYFKNGFPRSFPRIRLRDGGIRREYVRFWASLRHRAAEIWDLPPNTIRPGIDFSITEVVHCKSRDEDGVEEALATCKQRHWNRIMAVSSAKLVVVMGRVARESFALPFPMPELRPNRQFQNRWVITLPAPNSRKVKKKVGAYYSAQQLLAVRRALHGSRL